MIYVDHRTTVSTVPKRDGGRSSDGGSAGNRPPSRTVVGRPSDGGRSLGRAETVIAMTVVGGRDGAAAALSRTRKRTEVWRSFMPAPSSPGLDGSRGLARGGLGVTPPCLDALRGKGMRRSCSSGVPAVRIARSGSEGCTTMSSSQTARRGAHRAQAKRTLVPRSDKHWAELLEEAGVVPRPCQPPRLVHWCHLCRASCCWRVAWWPAQVHAKKSDIARERAGEPRPAGAPDGGL